jgi:hypothetical protein
MHARVVRVQAPAGATVERAVYAEAIATMRRVRGVRQAYWLGRASDGAGLLLTLWDSERALRAAAEPAAALRQVLAERFGVELLDAEEYEVYARA